MTAIRIVFWLIVVGAIALIIFKCKKPGVSFPWLGVIIVFTLLGLGSCGYSKWTAKKSTTPVATPATPPAQGTNPPPVRVVAIVPALNPWTFKTVTIPPNGVGIPLRSGWRGWPDKPITIRTPKGEVLNTKSGVKSHFREQPDGIYTFISDPPGVQREIEIYNDWDYQGPIERRP